MGRDLLLFAFRRYTGSAVPAIATEAAAMAKNVSAYGLTDVGRLRENNEDSFLIDDDLGLYVVCDGMGGHAAGEVASQKAAQAVAAYLGDHRTVLDQLCDPLGEGVDEQQAIALAKAAVENAAQTVRDLGSRSEHLEGMGTTLTMLVVMRNKGIIAHVGDSRMYLKRDGRVQSLTRDHTLASELVAEGAMEPQQVEGSRFAHVLTRSLGREKPAEVDTRVIDLRPGDCFLICSDGLSNYFANDEAIADLLRSTAPHEVAPELIAFANTEGGQDNITAVIVRVEETG